MVPSPERMGSWKSRRPRATFSMSTSISGMGPSGSFSGFASDLACSSAAGAAPFFSSFSSWSQAMSAAVAATSPRAMGTRF